MAALVLVGFVLWWRLWQGGVQAGPVHASLNKIDASDNCTSTSTTSSSGDHPSFAARRIVILPGSDHPLLARIGPLLRDELAALPFVGDVKCYAPGEKPPLGDRLPDLIVELELRKIDERSSLYGRTLTAKVVADMHNGAMHDSNGYTDNLSPPTVALDWHGVLEHHSTSIGDGVGTQRYQLTGPHIAKELAKQITGALKDLDKKYGQVTELPAAFYGDYRPAKDLDVLPAVKSPPVLSGTGLFCHNDTVWRFSDPRDAGVIFDEIENALKPGGWKRSDRMLDRGMAYLRVTNGPRMLNIAQRRRNVGDEDMPATSSVGGEYAIHYTDRFSSDEIQSALQTLKPPANVELMMSFSGVLTPAMRAQFIKQLGEQPAASPDVYLYLAQYYEHSDPAKAKANLHRAAALMVLAEDDSSLHGRMDDLAKKLKEPKISNAAVTEHMVAEMKLPKLTKSAPLRRSLALNEPFVAYALDANGPMALISICVKGNGSAKASYEVAEMIAGGMGKTYGRVGGNVDATGKFAAQGGTGFNGVRISWDAKENANGKFDVVIKREQ